MEVLTGNQFFSTGCFMPYKKVLMANGRFKEIQDLTDGDLIIGTDQKYHAVKAVCSTRGETYMITPKKGQPYRVSAQHLLCLKHKNKNQHKTVEIKVFAEKTTAAERSNWMLYRGHVEKFKAVAMPFEKTAYEVGLALNARNYEDFLKLEIPTYRYGRIKDRLEFLAGIADSKMTKTFTGYAYETRIRDFAELILFLCRSTGVAGYLDELTGGLFRITVLEQGSGVQIPSRKYVVIGDMDSMIRNIPTDHDPVSFKIQKASEEDYCGFILDDDDCMYMTDDFICAMPCQRNDQQDLRVRREIMDSSRSAEEAVPETE